MSNSVYLIGDIGGTNARFALVRPNDVGYFNEQSFECAEFETAEAAIRHYLETMAVGSPLAICLAVAGPVKDNAVRFTPPTSTLP